MKILLIGSGGREHALAWAISGSPLCDQLWIAPGNPGTAQCGENVVLDIADHAAMISFCKLRGIDLVVVGPEGPLVEGIADDLTAAGFKTFGPSKAAAQLEGSKGFTKELCAEFNIPTAGFGRFSDAAAAKAYVASQGAPIVIKADGLAAGKGVVMAETLDEANDAIDMMFSGGLGTAGAEIVIEEWMIGEEASFFALCDGKHALPLASAQDHKRVGDGDTGPNTGGMGAYSPAPVMTKALEDRVMAEIIAPTLAGMAKRGMPFQGILYAGLMITAEGPKLIEYNVRFGDPECEVLMPRLKSDIVPAFLAACDGVLDAFDLRWSDEAALTVVLAARGYPGTPEKGSTIRGIDKAEALDDVLVFHAGTKQGAADLVANGGRVLNVVGLGKSVSEAQKRAYEGVDRIDWPEGFCRRDIGWQAVKREQG
ncbi:phosphoribosylamine--glycine ligase [Bosea caraganae]|uniref:Phosphoribosylamine--glycine ligase n=1 Tax=Bosea caraganae TaxID=2763117 RepID=A0A370L499_9HYPH|nr:phosphoribosylamine--glycine ligase [Bosea caraganae]RDJ23669.1 phosphoribosylamine--glycine ligase [Bosea caraganae]RDJ24485.1 phosphoribosylamine--glycine ligase [Bosea caraganae]